MTNELQNMLNKADAEKDIDLFETACSLAFLQEQISNALKMTIIIARRNQRDNGFREKFTKALEDDAKEIEEKANEMFDVLVDSFLNKRCEETPK